jgi:hypothetical protein
MRVVGLTAVSEEPMARAAAWKALKVLPVEGALIDLNKLG